MLLVPQWCQRRHKTTMSDEMHEIASFHGEELEDVDMVPVKVIESTNYPSELRADTTSVRSILEQLNINIREELGDGYRLEVKEVSVNRKVYSQDQFDESLTLNPEANTVMILKEKTLGY